jgi:T-complex protein 1 subunit gamma
LELEEEYIKSICDDIIKFKPDLVITEKGISGNKLNELNFKLIK